MMTEYTSTFYTSTYDIYGSPQHLAMFAESSDLTYLGQEGREGAWGEDHDGECRELNPDQTISRLMRDDELPAFYGPGHGRLHLSCEGWIGEDALAQVSASYPDLTFAVHWKRWDDVQADEDSLDREPPDWDAFGYAQYRAGTLVTF